MHNGGERGPEADAEAAELVVYLRGLTYPERAAYCAGVLSGWTNNHPEMLLHLVATGQAPKQPKATKQPKLRQPRVRKTRPPLPPIMCKRCGVVIPRVRSVGRPRTVHPLGACPV